MKAVLGGGCFWCLEASYQLIRGVNGVIPGYAGGHTKNPGYDEVCAGKTGHAEVVQIDFDEKAISYKEVLDVFWVIHNPTTLNRQGNDVGEQYRSIILYSDEDQKHLAIDSIKKTQQFWDDPIITELKPLEKFYEAEPEHHNYFVNNPEQAYCQVIINPKLQKLRQKFANKLKQQ